LTKRARCIIKIVESGKLMKILVPWLLLLCLLACTSAPTPPAEKASAEPPSGEPAAVVTPEQPILRSEETPDQPKNQPEPAPGYRILKEGRHKHDNWLQLNEYFLIHHLYTDIFHRFGLHQIFSLEDKIRIFAGILYNLDFQKPVNLIIDDFSEEGSLVVSLQLIRIGQRRSVLLATNTDREGTKIYVGVENLTRTYKRSYMIVEDQLIALPDLYSEAKESKLIKENCADNLARFYIFDGNISNDTVAEGLLIGSIREADNALERSHSELILSRYYMSQNRLAEAQALLLAVGSQLARVGADAELREGYSITYEELLITSALKAHEEQMRETRPKSL
jgi:hypothetical protein